MDRIIEEVRRHTLPYVCNRAIKTLETIFNSLSMLKAAILGLLFFKQMKKVFTDQFQYYSKTDSPFCHPVGLCILSRN